MDLGGCRHRLGDVHDLGIDEDLEVVDELIDDGRPLCCEDLHPQLHPTYVGYRLQESHDVVTRAEVGRGDDHIPRVGTHCGFTSRMLLIQTH